GANTGLAMVLAQIVVLWILWARYRRKSYSLCRRSAPGSVGVVPVGGSHVGDARDDDVREVDSTVRGSQVDSAVDDSAADGSAADGSGPLDPAAPRRTSPRADDAALEATSI